MALTEEQKKTITVAINSNDFSAAAQALAGHSGVTDQVEVIVKFIENFAHKNKNQLVSKIDMVGSIIQQNISAPLTKLENALYASFPELSTSSPTAPVAGKDNTQKSNEDYTNLNLDELDKKIAEIKSEQATLIRSNKPLDPEKSKLMKNLQAIRSQKLAELEAHDKNEEEMESSSEGWFNMASSQEIGRDIDFEVCIGTAVLQTIQNRLNTETEQGHIVLSTNENIRATQEAEFIAEYEGEMPSITDGNEFIKQAFQTFQRFKKVDGELIEHTKGIDHGAVYKLGEGWLIIIRLKDNKSNLPYHYIYQVNIPEDIYYTIKFNRKFEGGNTMPDSYSFLEFKGGKCLTYVKSTKGVDVLDPEMMSRLLTQVRAAKKNFGMIATEIDPNILSRESSINKKEALNKAAAEIGLPVQPSKDSKVATPVADSDSVTSNTKTPEKEMDSEQVREQSKNDLVAPGEETSNQPQKDTEHDEDEGKDALYNPNNPNASKIANLQKLLQQAKINNQESTAKRLEEDIAKLQNVPAETSGSENPSDDGVNTETGDMTDGDDISDAEKEAEARQYINSALEVSGLEDELKESIAAALESSFDFDSLSIDQAKDLLKKYFKAYSYQDLIQARNTLVHDAKKNQAVPLIDQYITIYIELSYIVGDYEARAHKMLDESQARSDQIVKDQDDLFEELEKYEGKDLSPADSKKKLEIQDKIDALHAEGMELGVVINKARLFLDGDIAEIENHFPDCVHLSFRGIKPEAKAPNNAGNQEAAKYKDRLQKISEKLPEKAKQKFDLKNDPMPEEAIDELRPADMSADEIIEIATASGKPVEINDKDRSEAVYSVLDKVKDFDKYIASFFKKIDKQKKALSKLVKSIDKTQSNIIDIEKEIELIHIANRVKLAPIREKQRIIQEKLESMPKNKTAKDAISQLKEELKQLKAEEKDLKKDLDNSFSNTESEMKKLKKKLDKDLSDFYKAQIELVSEIYKLSPDTVSHAQIIHDLVIKLCKKYPIFYAQLVKEKLIPAEVEESTVSQGQEEGADSKKDTQYSGDSVGTEEKPLSLKEQKEFEKYKDMPVEDLKAQIPDAPTSHVAEEVEEDNGEGSENEYISETKAPDASKDSEESETKSAVEAPVSKPSISADQGFSAGVANHDPNETRDNPAKSESQENISTDDDKPSVEEEPEGFEGSDSQKDAEESVDHNEDLKDAPTEPEAKVEETKADQTENPVQQSGESVATSAVAKAPSPQVAENETPQPVKANISEEEENNILDKVYDETQKIIVQRDAVHSIESARDTIKPESFDFAKVLESVKIQTEINYAAEDLKSEAESVADEYDDVVDKFMEKNHEILMNNAKSPNALTGPSNEVVEQTLKDILAELNEEAGELTMDLLKSCCKTEFRVQAELVQAIVPALQQKLSIDEIVSKLTESGHAKPEKIKWIAQETAKILGVSEN